MASATKETPAPAPKSKAAKEANENPLPTSDQDFVFEGIDKAPGWVDKNWAGFDRGPALQLPNDLSGVMPYTTKTARIGDKVMFIAAKGSMPARFEVVANVVPVDGGTKRPAQESAAPLEDLLRGEKRDDVELDDNAKAEVASRTPALKHLVED